MGYPDSFLPSLGPAEVGNVVLSCATQQFAFIHLFIQTHYGGSLYWRENSEQISSPYCHAAYNLGGGDRQ